MFCVIFVLPKFNKERAGALHYFFCKANLKPSKSFLKSDFASIAKTNKLNFAIGVRGVGGALLHFDKIVLFCLLPNVSHSGHIAVDIESQQVLIVVEAVHLLDSLHQVSEVKTERVRNVVQETLVVALKHRLALS